MISYHLSDNIFYWKSHILHDSCHCPNSPVLSIGCPDPGRPVPDVLFFLSCTGHPSKLNCQAELSRLFCHDSLSWMSCRGCTVVTILPRADLYGCFVLAVLAFHVWIILLPLSCHNCPFLTVLSSYCILPHLSCPICSVPALLSPALLSPLSCPSTLVPSYPVSAVLSVLSSPCCPLLTVMSWLYCRSVLSLPSCLGFLSFLSYP